jgi:iron complex outermembrane receptor protein/hemoglobin/transferrin/lactoferrin receptor protein
MRLALLSSALITVLFVEIAFAQETQTDENLGARATTTRESFERARGVDHVTRTEADERGAANASDMLESAHGVTLQRTSSGSGTPIVRGLTGYQVLLMVDDLRLNDALTRAGGSASLNLIDPESIRDIEVIRGPASVLYGSDALGGVVHVRTQQPGATPDAETTGTASAYLRSASAEDALRGQASARVIGGNFGAFVSGGRGGSGLINRGDDLGLQSFTGHEDWSFASRLELVHTLDHRIGLSHQSGHIFDMPRSDNSAPDDVQITTALDRDAAVLSYDGRLLDNALRLHAYAGLARKTEHRARIRDEVQHERDQVVSYSFGVRGSGSPFAGCGLEVGVESTIESIGSTANTLDATTGAFVPEDRGRYVDGSLYQQHALYGLLTHALSVDWTVLAGARLTLVHTSAPLDPLFSMLPSADAELDQAFVGPVPSLGVRWQITETLSWVASVLGGFRAPNLEDFQAFGGGARGFTIPNQDLSEERSWTLESGVELDDERWRASAYAFGSVLDGLIVRVPSSLGGMTEIDGEPVLTRQNASTGLLVGAEATVLYTFDMGLYVGPSAWFTWGETTRPTETGDEMTEPATKLPGPTGAFRVGYAKQGSPWFAESVLTGQLTQRRLSEGDKNDVRLCADPETCTRVPGYGELTLRGGVRMEDHVLITIAIENLFDAGYRTYASGAYAPGRNFVAAVRGTL